jgi:hypothetical protein
VDRKKIAATAVRGDTTRGYIKVADIRATYRLARGRGAGQLGGPGCGGRKLQLLSPA